MENYTASVPAALQHKVVLGSAGSGRISSASRADYAEAAVAVLTAGSSQAGRTYELAGGSAFTLTEFAAEIARESGSDVLHAADIPSRGDPERGFDHGTFVPLSLMYPNADVPIVLLSLKSDYDPAEHIRVGQAIAPLRDEGVLILGSGLTYHNMSGFGRTSSTPVAEAFEAYLENAVSQDDAVSRNGMLVNWESAPAARLAHPREDHLLPLMAGAAGDDRGQRVFVDHVMQVAMASYQFPPR